MSGFQDFQKDGKSESEKVCTVSFLAYESMRRDFMIERKRNMIKDIIKDFVILAMVISFLMFLSQYDYENYELTADGSSYANYVGGSVKGDLNNGGTDSSSQDNPEGQDRESEADKGNKEESDGKKE